MELGKIIYNISTIEKRINSSDSEVISIPVGLKKVVMYHKTFMIPAIVKIFKNLGTSSSLSKKRLATIKEPP
jgi:hypothetical protein